MTARLYTASWAALWEADKSGTLDVQPVRISRGVPKFWPAAERFPALEALMPDGWMFSIPEDDPERFGRAYRRKLHTIGLEAIRRPLDDLAERHERPLVLACFEKSAADCHRGPLGFAGWYERKSGQSIPEWASNVGQPNLATTPTPTSGQLRLDQQDAPQGAEGSRR